MRREIVNEGERKNFSLKAPPGKKRPFCKKMGNVDYIDGKEVYVSSIEIRVSRPLLEVVVYDKGFFEEVREGRNIIGWNFVPCSKLSLTSVSIRLE